MSVFKVQLQNNSQGLLDRTYSAASLTGNGATPGDQISVSLQRQFFAMGPKRNMVLLKDGATFTGSNYWQRFCYPNVPMNQAILVCTSDDGSVYSDDATENGAAYSYALSLASASTYTDADNIVDILGDHGGVATFTQITNLDGSDSCTVKINNQATMTILANSTQVFNDGDLRISKLAFANASGGSVAVEVLVKVAAESQISNIGYSGTYGNTSQGTVFPLGPGGELK